ncbi:hypothetical protein SUGI_0508370 [Cryptomeria japonica]|nr:hypothetical protein SUGI_0508370 [Cryptomeria japonica]
MANLEADTVTLQHMELSAAQSECSDLELAFNLQLQEALAVLELEKFQQELADHEQAEAEMRRLSQEMHIRNHDSQFARSIQDMADDQWEDMGNDYEEPFDAAHEDRAFKLYFKGLISSENLGNNQWEVLAGAGIAIYDQDDKLVFQLAKPLETGLSRAPAEYMALTEGLKTAYSLGIRNVTAFGDSVQVHKQVLGSWSVRQRKISQCLRDVQDQLGKLDKVFMVLLTRSDNKYALTLAREAIDSQVSRKDQCRNEREQTYEEKCSICFEDNPMDQMYEIMTCHHRYCISCMAQHVEVKLQHGYIPECPHEGCHTRLTVDGCKKFLSPKWTEVLIKRLEEAAIPESDKVYCPYTDCSALMTKTAINSSSQACSSSDPLMHTKCLKCHRLFCTECRVPWHQNMSCQDYQKRIPQLHGVDAKLHLLATDNMWRRCTKCKHMIELAEGCNHMTCRCGFEFCYVCGAEWKNKHATCKCALWDEHHIIREPLTDDGDGYYDSEEEYETDDEDYEFEHEFRHAQWGRAL